MRKYFKRNCKDCGREYTPTSPNDFYCLVCKENRLSRVCVICGKSFRVKVPSERVKCCSEECGLKLSKKTFTEKYGREYPKEFRECISHKQKNNFKNKEKKESILEKRKLTSLKNSGYSHNMRDPKCLEKRAKVYFEKTGYSHQFHNPQVLEKRNKNNFEKYGFKVLKQSHITNYSDYNREKIIEIFNIENNFIDYKTRCEIEEYFNLTNTGMRRSLENMDFELEKSPLYSKQELRIREWIKDNLKDIEIIYNDRSVLSSPKSSKMLELDIYIPSLKVAIEFNGSYYHSNDIYFNGLTKEEYKTFKCLEQDIILYHIWDYENIEEKLKEILKCL